MKDLLLELNNHPQVREIAKNIGLPVPTELDRPDGPRVERPLQDRDVAVFSTARSTALPSLARTLCEAGANPHVHGGEEVQGAFEGPGEAFGRPASELELEGDDKFRAIVFDATGLGAEEADYRLVYDFFHPLVGRLGRNGRVVVLGAPPEAAATASEAAFQEGLQGFVRSLARELGSRGSTANFLQVAPGAEASLAEPLRFFTTERSAFVSGQPLQISSRAGDVPEDAAWRQPFEGKNVLITGAARGIGAATARIFADEGARVLALDLPSSDDELSSLAREIGGEVILADITDEAAPKQIADEIEEEYGGVDVVVHNAGITRDRTLFKMSPERWDQVIDVNLRAMIEITDELLDRGTLRDGGRLVCLSSVSGIAGNVGQTNYSLSKAGVIGFVRHLADDLADRAITVNAIAPGFIETRLTDRMPAAMREVARRMNNLSQGGRPRDVGEAIVFLSTPAAQGVTGEVLRVGGGFLVGR